MWNLTLTRYGRIARVALSAAVILVLAPLQSQSQESPDAPSPDEYKCRTGDRAALDQELEICNRVISGYRRSRDKLDLAFLYEARSLIYSRKGDFPRAFADIEQALQIYRKFYPHIGTDNVVTERGDIWARKNDFDKAIADYSEAVRLGKAGEYKTISPSPVLKLNGLWALRGRLDRVIASSSEYIDHQDQHKKKLYDNILIQRALAYEYAGSPAQALADLKRAIELGRAETSPYNSQLVQVLIWHDIIASRRGLPILAQDVKTAVLRRFPHSLLARLVTGRATPLDVEASAKVEWPCGVYYEASLWALQKGDAQNAIQYLRRIKDADCSKDIEGSENTTFWLPAFELKTLSGPQGQTPPAQGAPKRDAGVDVPSSPSQPVTPPAPLGPPAESKPRSLQDLFKQ